MTGKQVDCNVLVPSDKKTGDFANAFRVVQDNGREWFLDFFVYSTMDQKATLVSRIRVLEEFLPAIRDRLSTMMGQVPEESVFVVPGPGGPVEIQ